MTETTLDGLLNRRVMIEQPKNGFRVAVDTVLLAASVPAQAGQRVLDFGCGVGGAMLCLVHRVPGARVTGIDIQDDLVEMCRQNIERNAMSDRAQVLYGDVGNFVGGADLDYVMMNPPYHDENRHDVSENSGKRVANASKDGDLPIWI